MAQTNAQLLTNEFKVLLCVEHMLRSVVPANGFLTDGVGVVASDPRKWGFDPGAAAREKATVARVTLAPFKRIPGQVGDSRRWTREFEVCVATCLTRAQDRAGVRLEQAMSWVAHDVEAMCARDIDCHEAAFALNDLEGPWGPVGGFGGPPSCMNLRLAEGEREARVTFPVGWQVLVLQFENDSHGPNNDANGL